MFSARECVYRWSACHCLECVLFAGEFTFVDCCVCSLVECMFLAGASVSLCSSVFNLFCDNYQ